MSLNSIWSAVYTVKVILLIVVLCSSGCQSVTERELNHEEMDIDHWSYQGETSPEHWEAIENGADCGGKQQSPINIIDLNTVELELKSDLKMYYSSETHISRVMNNGHTVQFEFMRGDYILYDGDIYHLVQIHFHEHAEHLICGVVYPIEIHLVHINTSGKLTVLSILGMEGADSQIIELLEGFLPIAMGESKPIDVECDLNQMLPSDRTFYSYSGSLTTPPCTEGVNWVVFKNPIVLSLDEVQKLRSNMPINNYRYEQPLNGRVVHVNPA